MCIRDRGNREEADKYAARVRKTNANYAGLPNAIGEWLAAGRQFKEAEEYYRKAMAMAPELAEPVCSLGRLYMQTGEEDKAREILEKAHDLDDFRADVVACVIVGAAYGDLSAERVYIRAESLACIDEQDRDVFSTVVELKANAVGEDGKLGLRGRVVERRGKLLARAMIVGFLEGLSDVFRLTRRVTWYPFEVQKEQKVGTPSFGESLAAAGLSGFGSAMQRLADYYVEMFKGMYPVIEIEAGREISFVVMPPGAVMDYKNFFGVGR